MGHLQALAKAVNRRYQQEEFLYELCGRDFWKLFLLEYQIKKHFLCYCPGDEESVNHVLSL